MKIGGFQIKIEIFDIKNFRSLRDVTIYPNDILALVGQNNSGKSNVLDALELFFKASNAMVNKDLFYMHDEKRTISITITFKDLSDWEKEQFSAWMCDDKLVVSKEINFIEDKSQINTFAIKRVPEPEWLQEDQITGNNIKEWWKNKDKLIVNGLDFSVALGSTQPTVKNWKSAASDFLEQNQNNIPMQLNRIKNPKGYDGVLKGALPEFIYVPAVRDVSDEAKVGKTNPFGQLINSIFNKISNDDKTNLSSQLTTLENHLNKSSGSSRINGIEEVETALNEYMSDIMDCDIEIRMSVPKIEDIFSSVDICADDGIKTNIDAKGHGMQRSMIFTILRAYAELSHKKKAEEKANERSTIFAIEEPELYLHPQSQRTLMSVLKEISSGNDQVVYCTHSNLFVDIAYFDNICIMRLDKNAGNHQSNPTQLPVTDLIEDLKARTGIEGSEIGMRELHFNAFNEMINEGFFASKVIIVEGDSERYSFPIYANALGYDLDRNNIAVVHSHGKGPMDRLYRIFNGLGIPTYLIFDGDKNNTNSEVKRKTLDLLELLGRPTTDITSLKTKVSNKYAVFENNLEETLKVEIDDYDNLCNLAAKEIIPIGKPLRNKFIANQLKTKIDAGIASEDIIPATITEIIDKLKVLEYDGCFLQKCEDN